MRYGNAIRYDDIRQGDMIIARLVGIRVKNVAIADLLPAGFEIGEVRNCSRGEGLVGSGTRCLSAALYGYPR